MLCVTPKAATRAHKFTMVMTDEERAKLESLAESDRRSAADWLRVAIEDAYRAKFGDKKPKANK